MRAEKAHRDMDDRVEAFEIEPSYSEDPFTRGPRGLWGRVAALVWIATKFYGRTGHDVVALIEQANGMVDATTRPGQPLTTPPAPKASTGTTTTVTPKTTPKATVTPRASVSP